MEEPRAPASHLDHPQHQALLMVSHPFENNDGCLILVDDVQGLKDVNDECCAALRYQLARYAYAFEQAIASDGLALDDDHGMGLRSLAERIDKESDLMGFIQSYNNQNVSRLRGGSDLFRSKVNIQ